MSDLGDGGSNGNGSIPKDHHKRNSDIDFPSRILEYLEIALGGNHALQKIVISEMKSAQQHVWVLEHIIIQPEQILLSSSPLLSNAGDWQRALQVGNHRLVVRQWKASSCWWNLNRNQQLENGHDAFDELELLARSEVAGYRLARNALQPNIHIPNVLYFSLDSSNNNKDSGTADHEQPWAIFDYVGPQSTIFGPDWKFDQSWINGMVKTRFEFGFEEPHPRWGRVPENQCVEYSLAVLRHVTIPLHQYMCQQQHQKQQQQDIQALTRALRAPATSTGFTYRSMVDLYHREQQNMKQASLEDASNDPKLQVALGLLEKAIDLLTQQQPYLCEPLQPLVLCHMDCQPQNLLFAEPARTQNGSKPLPRISSVLDWEEAALADARFELLLLCRKVCANRQQAEQIWTAYKMECPQPDLGPLAPWLALETVHSITSFLLQSMDLLGGGRNPWESKPDLWDKIGREIRRLALEHDWEFADTTEFG